jgi:hypothetical protein
MKKTMIAFVAISIILLSSCYYIWPVYPEDEVENPVETPQQYAQVTSSSLFVYNGRVCIIARVMLPAEIYNPNNYTITINVDKIDYLISPLGTLELEAPQ